MMGNSSLLSILLCLIPVTILFIGAALVGDRIKRNISSKILQGREGGYSNIKYQNANKIKIYTTISLISVIGIFIVFTLLISKVLDPNIDLLLIISLILLFSLIATIFGILLLKLMVQKD